MVWSEGKWKWRGLERREVDVLKVSSTTFLVLGEGGRREEGRRREGEETEEKKGNRKLTRRSSFRVWFHPVRRGLLPRQLVHVQPDFERFFAYAYERSVSFGGWDGGKGEEERER